jgi:hypothetical protein
VVGLAAGSVVKVTMPPGATLVSSMNLADMHNALYSSNHLNYAGVKLDHPHCMQAMNWLNRYLHVYWKQLQQGQPVWVYWLE